MFYINDENAMYLTKTNYSNYIFKFIFNPFMYGLYGFFVFMITIILLKIFLLLIDSSSVFTIKENDFILGLLGFFAFFIIRVVNNSKFKKDK